MGPSLEDRVAEFNIGVLPAPPPGSRLGSVLPSEEAIGLERYSIETCLKLKGQRYQQSGVTMITATLAEVEATNLCPVTFRGDDFWIEVKAIPETPSGTKGRFRRMQLEKDVGPGETVRTLALIEQLRGEDFYRIEVALWRP